MELLSPARCHTLLLLAGLLCCSTSRRQRWPGGGHKPQLDDADCPTGCVCHTKQAFCDNRGHKKLPRSYPYDIETIHYRENDVRKVRHVHFRGMHQLKHLILKGNRVAYVEPSALSDLYRLVSLSFTQNNIHVLSPYTFKSQSRLQVLSLRHNKLKEIEYLFRPLESLRLLNLAHNRIKEITHKTFRGNSQLRVLDLNDNNIKHIQKHAFKQLLFLKFLVLRDNPLRVVHLDFRQNFHLELLDFTNCRLSEVVKGMPFSIHDLRLSENRITKINKDDFKTIRKVRLMVLNDNYIDYIHPLAFARLWQLHALYLGSNKLNSLPSNLPSTVQAVYANYNAIGRVSAEDLSHRPHLHTVLLKSNNISHIDQEAFMGVHSLEILDLRDNKIRKLKSMMFKDNRLLQKLDISLNPIEEMDHDCFKGLKNLSILVMSSVGNDSNVKPSFFKDTRNLLFLDLSNSSQLAKQMTAQPSVWEYISSVNDLNLMEDGLHTLPRNFTQSFSNLKSVKLVGNPWHCDYKLLWMREWLHNRSITFFSPDDMICITPPHLYGTKIRDLTENDAPAPWTPSIEHPIINLLNISFNPNTNNKNQKIYLGRDGKWYFFNAALHPPGHKGEQFEHDGRGEKSDREENEVINIMERRPQSPQVYVDHVQTYRSKHPFSGWKKKKKEKKKGKRQRGRKVAALNAMVPSPMVQNVPPKELQQNMDTSVDPTLQPAAPLQTPNAANTQWYREYPSGHSSTRTVHASGENIDTDSSRTLTANDNDSHKPLIGARVESNVGTPLYDDSSGLVSGEDTTEDM